MTLLAYDAPVKALLDRGYPDEVAVEKWPDYAAQFGLSAEHIPVLMQMLQDEHLWALWQLEEEPAFIAVERALPSDADLETLMFGPIHAWRALGQLQAIAAMPALIEVLQAQDMDWCWEELPQVVALMGPAALPGLEQALQDLDLSDENKITVVEGIEHLVQAHPDSRDDCIRLMTDKLAAASDNEPDLNGSLVNNLIKLKATESVAVIEAAYNADQVDQMFAGSWPAVQVSLGLKDKSDFSQEELAPKLSPQMQALRDSLAKLEAEQIRARKPTAWDLGLPIDRHIFDPTAPPDFKALTRSSTPKVSHSGFGGKAPKGKKKKKKR